jgi:hypothetical protein
MLYSVCNVPYLVWLNDPRGHDVPLNRKARPSGEDINHILLLCYRELR